MSANIIDLCNAVVDALNDAAEDTFSQTFTAEFEYVPEYTAPDADTLRVIVTDAGGKIPRAGRELITYADQVRVVVLWRVKQSSTGIDTSRMAEALQLVDEIAEYLYDKNVGDDEEFIQSEEMQRGSGEKDKQHYFPGNLEDRVFAASLLIPYNRTKSRSR